MLFICWLLRIYIVVLAARAILSWFPARPGTGLASLTAVLADLTEPLLTPLRRIIPPVGMFDVSFMVAFFFLFLIQQIVCSYA